MFLLSRFITEKKTSLSAPQLRVEHFSLYLLLVTLPLTHSASAESNLGRHFVLVTSAFSVESGEHRVFLQVRKGRKISGWEWEQDVFLCVCVFMCVCVCVLSTLDGSQSAIRRIGSNSILERKLPTRSQTKRVHPHSAHQSTPRLLFLFFFLCSDTVTRSFHFFSIIFRKLSYLQNLNNVKNMLI